MNIHKLPDVTSEDLRLKPIERAETVPSSWYHSDAMLEFEKEAIFSSFWQLACHSSELSETGDMTLLEVADNPLLVVRDKDRINAFYNVCKHRGGPVAVKKGTTSVLQCQYHGWTYLLDGSLRGVPQFKKVDLFDKKDFGLEPVNIDCWEGLHFVSLSDDISPAEEFLTGIKKQIAPIDLSEFRFTEQQSYIIDCNWKVYVDNFLEGYHIPIVHPDLAKLLDYTEYKTDTSEWYSLQHSPIRDGDNLYNSEDGKAFYYFIFPNIMLNILPGRLQTNIIRPLSTGKTEVIFNYYYKNPGNDDVVSADLEYSDQIQQEDIEICELVQKGLQSKAYDRGRYSVKREKGVYHFHSLLKKIIAGTLETSYK